VAEAAAIEEDVAALLQSLSPLRQGVRLLGVTLSNLHGPESDEPNMPLLDFTGKDQ
jgi:hypothetical protein